MRLSVTLVTQHHGMIFLLVHTMLEIQWTLDSERHVHLEERIATIVWVIPKVIQSACVAFEWCFEGRGAHAPCSDQSI